MKKKTARKPRKASPRFSGLPDQRDSPKSRNGDPLNGPTVSAKDARLLRLYEEDVRVRFAARTVEHYLANTRDFLRWITPRGLALAEVKPDDVRGYQADLYARPKSDGHPYAAASIALRLAALKVLYRF
jgi:hypothetical protein